MAPKAPAGAVSKGSISAFLGNLKSARKACEDQGEAASAVNKRKAEVLLHYESLSRFDKEKQEIVAKYAKDKSLEWWETHTKRKVTVNSVDTERIKGYATKVGHLFRWCSSIF